MKKFKEFVSLLERLAKIKNEITLFCLIFMMLKKDLVLLFTYFVENS